MTPDYLLHGAARITKKQKIANTVEELTAGLKLLGYECFDVEPEENTGIKPVGFINKKTVIVFYVSSNDTMDVKITDLKHDEIAFRTRVIKSVGLRDVPAILRSHTWRPTRWWLESLFYADTFLTSNIESNRTKATGEPQTGPRWLPLGLPLLQSLI